MSEVASLIADLIAANVPPELIGRVAEAIAGGKATKASRRQTAYTADFEAFWKAYPTDPNMSKAEAWKRWQKIDENDRALAIKAVPKFKDYCKQNDWYRPVHACVFISQRRFEGFVAQPELTLIASNPGVYVKQDSPEWSKYAEAYKAQKGKYPPVDSKGGWFFMEAV